MMCENIGVFLPLKLSRTSVGYRCEPTVWLVPRATGAPQARSFGERRQKGPRSARRLGLRPSHGTVGLPRRSASRLTSTSARKRIRLAPETRRTQILDESARLILEEGLHAVSMERIARDLRISKGLVYRYFPTRDALLAALMHREQTELRDRGMASALQAVSFADLIRQTTRLYLQHTLDRGALIAALLADPSVARLMEEDSRSDREQTIRYFVRAIRREFQLPLPLAIAVVDLLSALTDQAGRLVAQGQVDVDSATEMCVELITGGLSALDGDRPLKL
ncbi:TetR/AcrR family transcriptional regulator [Phenylobacterium aquaticum]|uniref:TetR/AcrR family transcriptional regulator n=1 Tax=Phenylobacterium aquaticum TaxID=1763816 RepID=UPI0026ED7782|nr:TetR/AcrR family transcriptional regulator [Phenylobacterium aquaticum]